VEGQPQAQLFRCRFCSKLADTYCGSCLRGIIVDSADIYQQLNTDSALVNKLPDLDKDPRVDLALVVGTSLLKLAGLGAGNPKNLQPPLRDVEPHLLLQAILIIDTQLKQTPSDNGLRLLLIRLYLLLGAASYADQLWTPMGVKRTIQDALSPLFFDRISTLSPGLFQGTKPYMILLNQYYNSSLRDDCPVRIWDAFSSGSYTSILDMSEYDNQLRRSCTLMMTLVEQHRAARAFGGKIDVEIADTPLACKLPRTLQPVL